MINQRCRNVASIWWLAEQWAALVRDHLLCQRTFCRCAKKVVRGSRGSKTKSIKNVNVFFLLSIALNRFAKELVCQSINETKRAQKNLVRSMQSFTCCTNFVRCGRPSVPHECEFVRSAVHTQAAERVTRNMQMPCPCDRPPNDGTGVRGTA